VIKCGRDGVIKRGKKDKVEMKSWELEREWQWKEGGRGNTERNKNARSKNRVMKMKILELNGIIITVAKLTTIVIITRSGVHRIFGGGGGGSTNSVEVRGQTKRVSGAGSSLVRG
jgi:hypothetical protein